MALKEKRQDKLAEVPLGYQSYCEVVQAAIVILRQDIHKWNFLPDNCSPITLQSPKCTTWKSLSWGLVGPVSHGSKAWEDQQLAEGHLDATLQICSKCHLAEP